MFQRNDGMPHQPPVRPTQIEARVAAQHGMPTHAAPGTAPAGKAEEMIALLNARVRNPSGR